jgi:hypothetical protein
VTDPADWQDDEAAICVACNGRLAEHEVRLCSDCRPEPDDDDEAGGDAGREEDPR